MSADIFEDYPELNEPFEEWWKVEQNGLFGNTEYFYKTKMLLKEIAQKAYLASYLNTTGELTGW